jgi:ATP-dependent Clp protease ATP-binding subunit ClpA
MTTNAGAFMVDRDWIGFSQESGSEDDRQAIEKTFPPEFRNRLDGWIRFDHLTPAVVEQVVDKLVAELEDQLWAKRVSLSLTERARKWLAAKGYNRKFGARPMARVIDREIRRQLADKILFGELKDGGTARVDEEDDKLALCCEPRGLRSDTKATKKVRVG